MFDERPGDLTDDDRLFNTDGPWELQTKMMWTSLGDYHYVEGFRRAAEVLCEHVAQHRADVDALAMPILFCYRQWIELVLKNVWIDGARLHAEDVDPRHGHDLSKLWRDVRPFIERAWPEGNTTELDRLGRVIVELAELDGPTGTGFRYARTKDGQRSLPDDLAINLHNIHRVMAKVELLLGGASAGIGEMLAWQRDLEREHGP